MADTGEQSQDSAQGKADPIALAEQAEAEAAEAEALAAAARARARAIKLRREAHARDGEDAEDSTAVEAADTTAVEAADTTVADAADATAETQPPQPPSPVPAMAGSSNILNSVAVSVIGGLLAVTICGLLGASGWMLWHHHTVLAERQRSAAYTAAAKQGVVNLTSLDFNKANEDVQRVLDSATGEFRDDFQRRADDFASVVKDSKAVTEGSVIATAVESMGKDSAVVLVLAHERVTNSAGAKDDPRAFRFRVSVVRDGDQLKISKVEFVL